MVKMTKARTVGSLLLICAALSGCAADLVVADNQGNSLEGFPVPLTEPYAFTREFTALKSG